MLSDAEKDALMAAIRATFERSAHVKLNPGTPGERRALRLRMRQVSAVIGVRVSSTKSVDDARVLREARVALDRWIDDDARAER